MRLVKKNLIASAISVVVLLAVTTFVNDSYITFVITMFLFWAIVGMNLNLLLGYAGIWFIAPGIFFGVGGYTAGWLSSSGGISPFAGIAVGGVFAVISSLLIGLPSLRLKGIYIALFSIVFQLLIATIAVQTSPFIQYWTGGPYGIINIPDISLGGVLFQDFNALPYFYLVLAIFVISGIVLYKLLRSGIGVALTSMREDETYASSMGVSRFKYKLLAFMVASFFMGTIGGVYAHFFGAIGLNTYSLEFLIPLLVMVVIGGLGTFIGPIIGAFTITMLNEYLVLYGPWRFVVFGLLIPAVLILSPGGIAAQLQRLAGPRKKVTPSGAVKIMSMDGSQKTMRAIFKLMMTPYSRTLDTRKPSAS